MVIEILCSSYIVFF